MEQRTSSNLVFEIPEGLSLVVSYQNATNPTDSEWDGWIAAVDALRAEASRFRLLAITEGGHPSRSQVERLQAAAARSRPLTAIVSPSASLRFVASTLLLFNPSIRCFSPAQFHRAFEHIGLGLTEDGAVVEAAVGRLRQRLVTPLADELRSQLLEAGARAARRRTATGVDMAGRRDA